MTVPPTITFDHPATLTFGDITVRLDHVEASHGVGGTFVSIPEENLAITIRTLSGVPGVQGLVSLWCRS